MSGEALLALAARAEAATGADRELDVAIGLLGRFYVAEPRWPGAEPMIGYVDDDGARVEPGNGAQDSLVPRYTASLDAALSLVPEGWGFGVRTTDDRQHTARASCWTEGNRGEYCYAAATPALALCCAALRARARAASEQAS